MAMIIDPIMRSSWLFYVAFPGRNQHSAATSFFLALGEVFRRFIWNFFRMENEHMTNVGHFVASRDVPLPFSLPSSRLDTETSLEAQPPPSERSSSTKTMGTMKRGLVRMTSSLRAKHAEDFGRRPGQEKGPRKGNLPDETDCSSDNEAEMSETRNLALEETRNGETRGVDEEPE